MTSLEGTIVLITGGGGSIGAAIAMLAADRGATIAVTDLDGDAAASVATSIRIRGGKAWSSALDVTDAAAIDAVATGAEQELGPLNAWVSNAGVSSMARFVDVSEQELDLMLDVNTKGVFLCGQVAARRLAANGGGRIVNTASMAGKKGSAPFLAHYVASKFAVVGMTQAMAAELAEDNITVNAVCPGYVTTPMQEREVAWEARLRGCTPEDIRHLWIRDTPLGRLETPEDVARGVVFLLSDDAAFITGEALAINGGAHMD